MPKSPGSKVRFDVVNVVFQHAGGGDALSRRFSSARPPSRPWPGPITGGAVEKKAGGPFRLYGFEQTSARICPSFHAHNGRALAHPVGHFRPVVRLEGIQRPIGIGHHANPTLGGDENGHVRGSVAGLDSAFGGIQDLRGVV